MNGTPDNDGKLLSYPYIDFPRIAEITLEASEDGQWTAATVANGDGGDFAHYLRDTSGKWQQVTHFEDGVKHVRFGRDHSLYMLSLKDAPRGKVLRLALNTPELSKATIVAPEAKGVVQEFEDPAVRERTRSHREGAPSTPPDVDSTVVGEKKNRAIVFFGEPFGGANVLGPADFVESFFFGRRLQLPNALFHPRKITNQG